VGLTHFSTPTTQSEADFLNTNHLQPTLLDNFKHNYDGLLKNPLNTASCGGAPRRSNGMVVLSGF
jgi:hypothetical protein